MKKIISVLCIAVLCFFITERTLAKKNSLPLGGHIVYIDTSNAIVTLYSMDLRSKKIKKLYVNKNLSSSAGSVSRINSDWLLFGMNTAVNNLVMKRLIVKFNMKTGETVFLRGGSTPLYMPSYNKILFLLSSGEEFPYGGLCEVDINKINKTKFIAKSPTENNQIIPVSGSEVVFRSKKENEILLYNVKNNKTKLLPIKNCTYPLVWRDKTKQLICFNQEKIEYFMTSLDGKFVDKFPLKKAMPVIYIPNKDMVIMMVESVRDFSPVFDLWAYDFATDKKELLSKDNGFRAGDGIYSTE